ncbi:phospholipase C/P1 nuclease domain-containing protein [Cercophora scortea]|uniref:Phospholipase C/P1 nuclease domain-containing protein n=1 Tax=Cercophora scortea TaxID=314031 RepID=A0AAE0MMS9_9PEZI|nr:phospholipase C/P1 nuclease domain-containing protein [Cercophora scortea]
MKTSSFAVGLAALPTAWAWGGFGHITVAYVASNFMSNETAHYFQGLFRNDTQDYLAGVATWADSIRYTQWGRFTAPFHYIDAHDDPPSSCEVDYERDCKKEGCIVSAIQNYTSRLLSPASSEQDRAIAAKFIVHFIGDIHQPLHDEDVAKGGNGIIVTFDHVRLNLHHVWDSSIAEKAVGGVRRQPYAEARRWADELTAKINDGKFNVSTASWLEGVDLADPVSSAMVWAREGNAFVCTTVMPQGPAAITGQELGADYFEKAVPVVEIQIAKAGYRLAAWLDLIASSINSQSTMGDL